MVAVAHTSSCSFTTRVWIVISSREWAATLARTIAVSPKYTGLANRTENVPWSSQAQPSAATTGCVIQE
jgi:hypothetical protein